jgi:FixJ family two-component response regulator
MEARLVAQRQPVTLAQASPAQIHIIDDDAAVRSALVRLLRSRDYEVIDYPSAESFLASHDPDEQGCILLDVSMPGLDGPGL